MTVAYVYLRVLIFVCALSSSILLYSLTDVLAKDATAHDPGRVINISSIAGLTPIAYDDRLTGGATNGLWSCKSRCFRRMCYS